MWRSKVAWGYVLAVGLIWALGEWVGEGTLPTLLLAYAPPLLWLLPAPLVLVWTLWPRRRGQGAKGHRRGWGAALLGTALAAWGAGLPHWTSAPAPSPGPTLSVVTFNVARGTQATPSALGARLRAMNADLILLQESNLLRPGGRAELEAALPGYRAVHAAEVSTFTRLPVQSVERFDLPQNRREVLLTRLLWQGQPLSVVNAHLGTVQLSSLLTGDLARVERTRQAREVQVRVLEGIAAREGGRLLLAGDLNTPPRGRLYRRLLRAYGPDAHDLAGRGLGHTFPGLFLRIDHQLGRGLTPLRAEVGPPSGSDHLPLTVQFR